MPFGSMVTSLSADLTQYERDLNAAYAKAEAWAKRVEALQTRLSAPGVSGGRGTGGSGNIDADFRRIESARQSAEAEERRREGARAAAEREERRRGAEQPRAERENIRRDEQREASARRVVAIQQNAERENVRRDEQRESASRRLVAIHQKAQQEDEQRDFRRLQYQERRRDNDRKALAEQTRAERENIRRDEQRESAVRRAAVIQQKAEADNIRRDEQHEASVRRTVVVQQKAEADNVRRDLTKESAERKMVGIQQEAAKVNAQRIEEANRRAQEQARSFFRQQTGAQAGFGGAGVGGRGSFLAPASLRGLGEAEQAWLKQQQAIVKTGSLLEQFGLKVGDLGVKGFGSLVEHVKQFGSTLASVIGVGVVGGLVGGLVAVGKAAIDVDRAYAVGKIALAETLSLTTDLVDRHGKLVSASRQMAENYAVSAKLYQQIRTEAIKTTLTTGELLRTTEQSMAFAIRGGARVEQVVPLVAQIANLSKSLGARGEREIGFEERALLTGVNLARSRIGRALGLSRDDVQQARDAGKIVEYLSGVLAKGKPFLEDYARSYDGLVSTLQSKTQELLRQGTEKTFVKLTASIGDLNKRFDEKTISAWADRLSEVLAQTTERLQILANLPVWKTLRDNFGFLLIDEGEAKDRETAARRTSRGPERSAVELARIQVQRRRDELTALQGAAAGRALPLAERAGAGPKMISNFISPDDQRAIAVQQRLLDRDVQRQKAAEDALSLTHIQNELQKTRATGDQLRRVSRVQSEVDQKRREEAEKERVDVAQQLAKLHNDKRAQILADSEADRQKAREDIKDKTRLAAVLVGIDRKKASDLRELERDTAEQARGLARKVLDDQTNFAKSRVAITKEIHSAERNAAKEIRELIKERIEAERNLQRAQVDRITTLKRLGREEERSGLTKQAESLFDRLGISKQLQQQFTREELGNFPDIKQASAQAELRTRQAVREMAAQLLQPGGTSGVLESLRGRGVEVFGPSFRQEAERLQVGTAGLGEQDVMATRGEEALQRQRARNDAGRPVQEAQRRLQDVDRRGGEIRDDFNRTIKDLNERFGNEVRQRADDLAKLGEEARKLRQEFADSHMVFQKNIAPVLAQAAGVTPAGAQRQVAAEAASTTGLIVNGLHIHLTGDAADGLKALVQELGKQRLRTAPARR